MKRKLIAVVLFGLASAQAGVALADNNDVFADSFWSRPSVASEGTLQITPERTNYEQVDRYNP
ncbi:MAG TPA: hypothetical protein VJM14_05505 [Burkholderiales bacterium]|jgi:hypothetical protein|nr:hypothetical protein [Burkholderiales bacterium]